MRTPRGRSPTRARRGAGPDPDLEELGAEVIRAEADAFAAAVKRRLTEAGAQVTSFHADYE